MRSAYPQVRRHVDFTLASVYQYLLACVWGEHPSGNRNALAVLVRRLRQKLVRSERPHYVRTVHGRGYTFEARAAKRSEPAPAGDARVLVVDDDAATVNLVTDVLHDAGYRDRATVAAAR